MEDIRFYDFEFNLLHIENDIKSSNWTINHNDFGTWEGHFSPDSGIVPLVVSNPYLVIVQGDKQAIITGKQATEEGTLYGRTVNWILTRRAVHKFKSSELPIPLKDSESIARYLVEQAFSDVDNFVLGDTAGSGNERDFWRNTTNPLNEVVKDCLALEGLGHKVIFDTRNKQWVFRVIKGKRLLGVVSEANRTAFETEYTEDLQEFYTSGWYERQLDDMGEWNASTNVPALTNNLPANYAKYYRVSTAGTRFGITFKEGDLIVCRQLSGVWAKAAEPESVWTYIPGEHQGIYKWDAVLSGSVESEARSSLKSKAWEKRIKSKTANFEYGVNYSLGDTIRVQKQQGDWNATFEKQIVGVNIWYEDNDIGQQPIFEEGGI